MAASRFPTKYAVCLVIGASVGIAIARRIKITSLPQMVGGMQEGWTVTCDCNMSCPYVA